MALIVASKASLMDIRDAAPHVLMASALIDLDRAEEGLDESQLGEQLKPTEYSSSTLSRANRVLDNLDDAIEWAEETLRRAPGSPVGLSMLAAAARAASDAERLEKATRELEKIADRAWAGNSERYIEFLTALEFLGSGERQRGLELLRRLEETGYQPAKRKRLELEDSSRARPADRRPPR